MTQEVKPLGIEVIEMVTGFVQSNVLHQGLYAPEGSVYLPLEDTNEDIKYQGNANEMPTDVDRGSIAAKLMRRVNPEIWEGEMSRFLHLIVTSVPLRL